MADPAPLDPAAPASPAAPTIPDFNPDSAADALFAGASRPQDVPPLRLVDPPASSAPASSPAPGARAPGAPGRPGRPKGSTKKPSGSARLFSSPRSEAAAKANATRKAQAAQPLPGPPGAPGAPVDRMADAMGYNVVIFGLAVMWLGQEVAPTSDEAMSCNAALADYLRQHPDWKPRPELVLMAVYLGWLGNKIEKPSVRDRMRAGWGRAKDLSAKIWGKLSRKKQP